MQKILQILKWVTIKGPLKLFKILNILSKSLNNITSFTLNLKLFFVPLFGDYTILGRFLGIFYRTFRIIIGVILLSILLIVNFTLPILWYIVPFYLLFINLNYFIVYFILIFSFSFFLNINKPFKKVSQSKNNMIFSFTYEAKKFVSKQNIDVYKIVGKMVKNKKIIILLKKVEVYNTNFINQLRNNQIINTNDIIKKSYEIASTQGSKYVEIEHVFLSILKNLNQINNIFLNYNTNFEMFEKTIKWLLNKRQENRELFFWQDDFNLPPAGGIGRGMTGRVTPILDLISEDYTKMVTKGYIRKSIERIKEVENIAEILSSNQANVLIIGEAGSGKTTIVKGIAFEIIKGTSYPSLNNKRIVSLNIGKLLTGTKTTGEVATKITLAFEEIKASKDIILFVDEIHELVKGDNELLSSVYSILEPYIGTSNVQFIGSTTVKDYRKYIEQIPSFARLFNIVEISEASVEQTIRILEDRSLEFEKKFNVFITYPAIENSVTLSTKLIHQRVLPDKAILVLGTACSKNQNCVIDTNLIKKELAEYTKIPIANLTQDETEKILNLEKNLKSQVIGQDLALTKISEALKRARAGIRNENKPIASFLFVGTTGVGKTQTAKALALNYFGDIKNMIRLDMSEYQQIDSINRLLGSSDGINPGYITDQVRSKPFALILLDEIEKAHQNIILTFLQVLDDGRLTDNTGVTADFTNTIIIATSNVGTSQIQQVSREGGNYEEMQEKALIEVRNKYAPEFLNRFTDIIVFHPLSTDNLRDITKIELKKIEQMALNKGIKVSFKKELIDEIIRKGYNPEYGARPLNREIENSVEIYLAQKILEGKIHPGDILDLGMEVYSDIKS